ncbi:MAG: helix-turn-helix domain-containing protein [Solirubrobacteraceae bacterium]
MSALAGNTAAELLSRIRRQSGFSQSELALRSGVDRSALSAYEHGRRQPSVAALSRVAAAAGLELDVVPTRNAAADEHAGRVLSQVIELAESLPYKPKDELLYPPLIQLRS